jgi:hypothetical protein
VNKWAAVALLWLVCFFNYADRQAIYSVFPLLKTEMGLTDVQLGLVGASRRFRRGIRSWSSAAGWKGWVKRSTFPPRCRC